MFEEGPAAWRIEAYFPAAIETSEIKARLAEVTGRAWPGLQVEAVPALNWVVLSQAALPPVRAGRFTIHGSHDRGRVPRGPVSILIDAGEAFGTAHHATTEGCLVAIDRLTRRRCFRSVLDLGCGSGVLAIAVRRALPAALTHVTATDIDPEAVRVARGNVVANGLTGRVELLACGGLDHPRLRRLTPFDLVIANILAGPLIALAKGLAGHVAPKGSLVLSGLLIDQASEVITAYRAAGFILRHVDRRSGWATLELVRRGRAGAAQTKPGV